MKQLGDLLGHLVECALPRCPPRYLLGSLAECFFGSLEASIELAGVEIPCDEVVVDRESLLAELRGALDHLVVGPSKYLVLLVSTIELGAQVGIAPARLHFLHDGLHAAGFGAGRGFHLAEDAFSRVP